MRWLYLFSSVLLGVCGQLSMKKGVSLLPEVSITSIPSILKTIFQPYVFCGLVLYGISAVIWLYVISKFPLSVAYPMLSMGYVLVMVLSCILFKEPLTVIKIVGALCICFGVFLISR
jgi:multidrug transporter EmrE-like cation transporter